MTSVNELIKEILKFKPGDWYSNEDLRKKLQNAYNKVDFKVSVNASDICSFYNAKRQQQRELGVQINGYLILPDEAI